MPFATEDQFIDAAEAKLGVRLPKALRARLRNTNGGEVEIKDDVWQLYPVFDTSDRKRTTRTANDIVRETTVAREWRGFPPAAVAIAANGSGDLLVLLPSAQDPSILDERIYVWDHETTKLHVVAGNLEQVANGEG